MGDTACISTDVISGLVVSSTDLCVCVCVCVCVCLFIREGYSAFRIIADCLEASVCFV